MEQNISLEKAQSLLLGYCKSKQKENVSLSNVLGRVIAEDIKAEENIPPFDRSPLDGYTFIADNTEKADSKNPTILEVIEEVPAGYMANKKVVSGTAIKVMTGAPIPKGADAVEKYEKVERFANKIKVFSSFKPEQNLIKAGEDVKNGDTIISKGVTITSPEVGLLASLGINKISVYKQPKVALVSTGDELIDVVEPLKPGKIRNSNRYSLECYCREVGAQPVVIGTAKDRVTEVAELIEEGLEKADMVVTTGGVSVGDYDVVMDALKSTGAEIVFWKINIKPGMPTMAAIKDGKIILGLSGNPASSLIVFQLLGIPFIKKMSGKSKHRLQKIEAILQEDYKKHSPKRRFLRGKLVFENGTVNVKLTGSQGNAILSSMIGCNVLVDVPAKSEPLKVGEKVTTLLVDKIN